MEQHEQELFDLLYAQHLQALKLQGKRGKTIDGSSRAVRRIAGYFNCCPDNLTAADLKTYFAWMVENYSWSSVKVDLWGLSLFYRHILGQPMDWVDIIMPPNSSSLPDIPTRQEVHRLINSVYRLRYRVYFFQQACSCTPRKRGKGSLRSPSGCDPAAHAQILAYPSAPKASLAEWQR
jgi:integrase